MNQKELRRLVEEEKTLHLVDIARKGSIVLSVFLILTGLLMSVGSLIVYSGRGVSIQLQSPFMGSSVFSAPEEILSGFLITTGLLQILIGAIGYAGGYMLLKSKKQGLLLVTIAGGAVVVLGLADLTPVFFRPFIYIPWIAVIAYLLYRRNLFN